MTWVLDTAPVLLLTVLLLPPGRALRRKEVTLDAALQAVLELSLAKDVEHDQQFK